LSSIFIERFGSACLFPWREEFGGKITNFAASAGERVCPVARAVAADWLSYLKIVIILAWACESVKTQKPCEQVSSTSYNRDR